MSDAPTSGPPPVSSATVMTALVPLTVTNLGVEIVVKGQGGESTLKTGETRDTHAKV